jgi:hypothetical protein
LDLDNNNENIKSLVERANSISDLENILLNRKKFVRLNTNESDIISSSDNEEQDDNNGEVGGFT